MSGTAFRGGYVRGISAALGEDDGVDAGAVSDLLVNNAQHLFDAHHSHIANLVTLYSEDAVLRQTEPNSLYYVLVDRIPFEPIEQADGGSASVIYRLGFRRSGGSGSITIGVRIGTQALEPFLGDTTARSSTHTTSSTTSTAERGSLYVPAEVFNERHPLRVTDGDAGARQAWFEVWCIYTGTKPTVEITSLMARQYLRAADAGGFELREDGGYELREDGGYELRE